MLYNSLGFFADAKRLDEILTGSPPRGTKYTQCWIYLSLLIYRSLYPVVELRKKQWGDDTDAPKAPRLQRRVLHGVHTPRTTAMEESPILPPVI